MAEFSDIQSGFDLELLIDENFIRHFFQLMTDGEPGLINDGDSLFKNFETINRDYNLNYSWDALDEDLMRIIEFEDEDTDYFYLALSPMNFPKIIELADNSLVSELLLDLFAILRIKRSFNLSDLIQNLKQSEGDNVFDIYGDVFRLEGVNSGLSLNLGSDTFEEFKQSIRVVTKLVYETFTDLHDAGEMNLPDTFDGAFEYIAEEILLVDSNPTIDNYDLFLKGFHNSLGISAILKDAVQDVNTASPFIMSQVHCRPFSNENKLGLYGNLNTIQSSNRGIISNAMIFCNDEVSGIGFNLNEELAKDLVLSIIRFEMLKKLQEGDITGNRFNEIEYSFPFQAPSEILDDLGLPGAASFFEINKVKLDFKRHKFPDQEDKIDALELELILSNVDEGFFENIFDVIVPNPHVKIFLGFGLEQMDLKLFIDGDIKIPFNLFTSLLVGPVLAIVPGITFLVGTLGFTIISNIVVDALAKDSLEREETQSIGFSVLKKRWDPFYYTHHRLECNILNAQINEDTQIKILFDGNLSKSFEPYPNVYVEEISFNESDEIQNFNYRFNSLDDLIYIGLPGTDRIVDLYQLNTMGIDVPVDYNEEAQGMLIARKEVNKIRVDIPYGPQFITTENGSIQSIRVLSELRQTAIRNILLVEYRDSEVQKILDLFFELLLVLVPDYDIDSITNAQLAELRQALRTLVVDSGSYVQYRDEDWLDDLEGYLVQHTEEMLNLSPTQLVMMGMRSLSVTSAFNMLGRTPDDGFDFLELPGYQAVAIGENIFIRNIPNDERGDNLSQLTEWEEALAENE